MAEELLHHAEVRTAGATGALQQVRGRRVAQQVRPTHPALGTQHAAHHPVDGRAVQGGTGARHENPLARGHVAGTRDARTAPVDPRAQGVHAWLGHGNGARVATLPHHGQHFMLEVQRRQQQVAGLLTAQPASVQHLHQCTIAKGQGFRRGGRSGRADMLLRMRGEGRGIILREPRHRAPHGPRGIHQRRRAPPPREVRREPLPERGEGPAAGGRGPPDVPEGRLQHRWGDGDGPGHVVASQPCGHPARVAHVPGPGCRREGPGTTALARQAGVQVAQRRLPCVRQAHRGYVRRALGGAFHADLGHVGPVAIALRIRGELGDPQGVRG